MGPRQAAMFLFNENYIVKPAGCDGRYAIGVLASHWHGECRMPLPFPLETVGIGSLPPFRFVWHRDADKQLLALTARDRLRRNDDGLESALRSDALAYVSVRSPVRVRARAPRCLCGMLE